MQNQKRNNGSYKFYKDKLIVETNIGQSSVSIQDIISISWRREISKQPNWIFLSICLLIMFSGIFFPRTTDYFLGSLVLMIVGAALIKYALVAKKIEWDNVLIETRGGQLLKYSIDINEGKSEVEKIEKELDSLLRIRY